MAIFSRQRPPAQPLLGAVRRYLTFRIGPHACALPIEAVLRVAVMESFYADPRHPQLPMTRYKGKELLLMDWGREIFRASSLERPGVRHLLLAPLAGAQVVGLPIDSPPQTRSFDRADLQPPAGSLSPAIAGVVTVAAENCRYFVLNLASL
jgi:chemotaxis signal transduction protein